MRGFWKNQKGVTMMEVLVTVAILAIVVVPCLSSFVMAQRGNVLAEQTFNEYTEAQNLMETLKGVRVSEEDKTQGVTWNDKVLAMIDEVKANTNDNISIECHPVKETVGEVETTLYYIITIYTGEAGSTGDNEILKGVIAP